MIRIFFVALFVFSLPCFGAIIHVPGDEPTIQHAISASTAGDTVLVAPGTYVENIVFLGKLIHVKSSDGPAMTVIDGNSTGPVVSFLNAEGPPSVIEGFTITNGSADKGGGVFCKEFSAPTITGNIIAYNSATVGGGIYCEKLSSTIDGNVILSNTAGSGGGIYAWFGMPYFINNTIAKNSADTGGGIYCADNAPVMKCNTIAMNTATFEGGGVLVVDSHPTITNSILWDNSSLPGPQIYVMPHGSVTVSYSDVEGGYMGVANLDVDPAFVNPASDDFHLGWLSPCINMGTNLQAPAVDIDGDVRPYMGTVDIGSDEATENLPLIANRFTIPAGVGGSVIFGLDAGAVNGNRNYLLLASLSGTLPGTPLPGGMAVLPLNVDMFTKIVLWNINTHVFKQFMGVLSPSGKAYAQFNVRTRIPTSAPIRLSFAYGLNNTWNFVSNPVNVVVKP